MTCVIVGKSTALSLPLCTGNMWILQLSLDKSMRTGCQGALVEEGLHESQRVRAQRCLTGQLSKLVSATPLTCRYCLLSLCDNIHITFKIFEVVRANFGSL